MSRGFGKIHTKKKHSGQNTIENAKMFRQNTYKKKAFWAKYNGECVEVSAKYIQKNYFWAKYNGE